MASVYAEAEAVDSLRVGTVASSSVSITGACPASANRGPTCLIVLGMAGSGKTTFVQRITSHLHQQGTSPYVVNLDPAVASVPFPTNIDIRDTVNYKEIMKQYNLGPNGGIMTSLNLFTTRFDQVLNFLENSRSNSRFVIFDTPGQIEIFTWSASGTIITETLAASYTTVIIYVMDTAKCVSPVTFMSNMLYACSILYKTKLPFIVILNKADIVNPTFALEWMNNFEQFEEALEQEKSYMSDLTRSLGLVLDEFYAGLKAVGFSALTGEGIAAFFNLTEKAEEEFQRVYKEDQRKVAAEKEKAILQRQEEQLKQLQLDASDKGQKSIFKNKLFTRSEVMDVGTGIHLNLPGFEVTEDESNRVQPGQEEEQDEEEVREYESFKRFLSDHSSAETKKANA